jgi:hypothetical protein
VAFDILWNPFIWSVLGLGKSASFVQRPPRILHTFAPRYHPHPQPTMRVVFLALLSHRLLLLPCLRPLVCHSYSLYHLWPRREADIRSWLVGWWLGLPRASDDHVTQPILTTAPCFHGTTTENHGTIVS